MKYTNLYRNIKNPLDDPEVLDQLIDAYAKGTSFYSALTNRHSKDKKMYYSKSARDELHASIFNTWKKELLSITREQYEQAIKDGLYKRNIFKLISFLKTAPDVKTADEANAILNKAYSDKDLEDAMEAYRWDSIGLYSGWTHISARHINGKKTRTPKIEHRLYINTNPMDVHTMSKIFMDKCAAKKLPFYFKIGEFDKRDDNIVIYSDTKLLPKYLEVLKEIEKEYPDLVKRCGKPPVLSGVIRNWIGYGSEPITLSGKESFNGIRSKSIEKAIDEELLTWYKTNKNATVTHQGRKMSLTDYLAEQVVKNKISSMIAVLRRNPNSKYIKYTEAEISSSAFKARMLRQVKAEMPKLFNDYLNGTNSSVKIDVPIKTDATATLYRTDITKAIKGFVSVINANDPNFIKRVKARIVQDAKAKGIDPNKYCFDVENVKLLVQAEAASEKQSPKKPVDQQPVKKPVDQQQPKKETKKADTAKKGEQSPYHRPAGTPMYYKPMTDEEILEARKKLAECPPVKSTPRYQQAQEQPKYHRPAGTPMYYKPMTDEEILEARKKLAECPPVKVKKR